MNTQRFLLIASSALLTSSALSFAEEASTGGTVPTTLPKEMSEMTPSAAVSYPYGEPKITKDDKGTWTALLPSKGFMIKSEWAQEPEFQMEYGPDKKFQGAVSLATIKVSLDEKVPHTLHLLVNIYDPQAIELDMSSPERVIQQLITEPTKEAEQRGFKLETAKIEGSAQKGFGVLEDIRRRISIFQEGKGMQTQFYRVIIGKDFVVLGLVIGAFEGLQEDAKTFFDSIAFESAK